ncbi:MAG: S41 family peptidase [Rikenellaceae bacterium]
MKLIFRYLGIAILATTLLVGCNDSDTDDLDDDDDDQEVVDDPEGVTAWIDETLCDIYLYNTEYAALESKDYSLSYSNFLETNLTSLTTNVLDYKLYSDGNKYLFSYITRTDVDDDSSLATRAAISSGYKATDFGFVSLYPVQDSEGTVGLYVLAVYNDSPAALKGIRRGMVIRSVGGVEITVDNYTSYWYSLYYPTESQSVALKCFYKDESNPDGANMTVTVSATSYEANPVLKSEIIAETSAGVKIGYLNYCSFEYSYDSDMLLAFKELHEAGADELILDLRYNLGGYVSSASKMMSALTNTSVGNSQVFQYYRFNDDMTKDYSSTEKSSGVTYDSSKGKFYENLSGVAADYQLQLPATTIYCLVGYDTASASEMIINSLRGMDGFNVVTIGQSTRGKNVGMFVYDKTFENFEYELAPITFENFNCKVEGGYEAGFTPDHYVPAFSDETSFYDFSVDEYLIKNAISLIKGEGLLYSAGGQSVAARSGDDTTAQLSAVSGAKRVDAKRLNGAYKMAK